MSSSNKTVKYNNVCLLLNLLLNLYLFRLIRKKRKTWIMPGRNDIWWENLLTGKMDDSE